MSPNVQKVSKEWQWGTPPQLKYCIITLFNTPIKRIKSVLGSFTHTFCLWLENVQNEGYVWTFVMELRGSPERPCWSAFVSNYCLIKHAGQLPGSNWVATGTQLYTECLQPVALLSGPLQKQMRLTCTETSVCFNATSPTYDGNSEATCAAIVKSSLSPPHKGNTIIFKRLWSLVIEFSKGTEVLRDEEGELLGACVELKERKGGRGC